MMQYKSKKRGTKMNVAHFFLKLTNHKVDEHKFAGASPVASGAFSGKDNDCFDLNFPEPTSVNAITLSEQGERVTDFEIYVEKDGKLEMVYRQNRISEFRFCAIDEITTSKIRIKILKTRKGSFKNVCIYAYQLEKKKTSFRKMAYVVTSDCDKIDKNNLKYYNQFNIIGSIAMSADGRVYCKDNDFERMLSILREHDKNADVVVTMFADSSYVKTFKNKNTVKNIKEFLNKYALNGVSFDWEFPKSHFQWKLFDKFIVELKKEIGDKRITLALPSWLAYRFSSEALDCIETAEVMTYDNMSRDIDGHHSEFFSDCANAVYHYVKKGFKLSQIDLGLPYYARPVNGTAYWSDYRDEAEKLGWFSNVAEDEYQDVDVNKKPITVKPRFYNSCQMIADKTAFCVHAGVGGIMVWSLGSDIEENNDLCLSKLMSKTVSDRTEE